VSFNSNWNFSRKTSLIRRICVLVLGTIRSRNETGGQYWSLLSASRDQDRGEGAGKRRDEAPVSSVFSRRIGACWGAAFERFQVPVSSVTGCRFAACCTLSEEFLARADIQALICRSTRTHNPALAEPPFSSADQVILHRHDGSVPATRPVRHASASRHRQPNRAAAFGKFAAAAGPHLPPQGALQAFEILWRLDLDRPIAALLNECRFQH